MKISLFALVSLLVVSSADQQKLRRRDQELGKLGDTLEVPDGKFNKWPSNVVVQQRDPILVDNIPDGIWWSDKDEENDKPGRDEDENNNETKEHEAPPNEGKDDPMSDVRLVAKMARLSVEDATLLLQQQRDFSEVATILQNDESFLQTEMPPDLNGDFVIKVKGGKTSSEGVAAIRNFAEKHAKAQVKVEESRLSLQDAEDRAEHLSSRLEKQKYGQVSYTIDGDAVDIEAKKPPNDKSRDIGKISKEKAAKLFGLDPKDEDLLDVVLILIDFEDEDIAQPEHTYGGRQIYGGGSQCTNAFSVVKISNGAGGTATAGHCDGMTTYNAVPPEADYALTSTAEHEGKWGDLQWHRTNHLEPAEYYSRPTTRWPVRSIANSVSKGEWVCNFSRMQGRRKCDRVFRTCVSVNYSCCPKMKRLVAMEGKFPIGGDSGGPWSWYDKAYGVHSGWKTICNWWIFGCHKRSIWSRVSYLDEALGVRVRTS